MKIEATPLDSGRKWLFRVCDNGTELASIEATPKPTRILKRFAKENNLTVDQLLAATSNIVECEITEAEIEEAEQGSFSPTGDPVLDSQLAGCVIPPSESPGGPTDWRSCLGDLDAIAGDTPAAVDASALPSAAPPDDQDNSPAFELRIRGRYEKAETATRYEGPLTGVVEAALTDTSIDTPDAVIEWSGKRALACLDVDWHGKTPPSAAQLDALISCVQPKPNWAWRTHNNGLHLLFVAVEGFHASELAACAAISLLDQVQINSPQVEVLSRTSHPLTVRDGKLCGEIVRFVCSLEGMLDAWQRPELVALTPAQIKDVQTVGNWKPGARLPHTDCPFQPYPNTSGGRPVIVSEEGVKCFVCAAHGHKNHGFASWAKLGGYYADNRVLDAAHGWVYADQAEHMLKTVYPEIPANLLRRAWVTLLKLIHGPDDPRISLITRDYRALRGQGGLWLDKETLMAITPRLDTRITQSMPSAMTAVKKKDKMVAKLDVVRHGPHQTNQPIPGFPIIVPIRGIRLWGHYNAYPGNAIRSVVPVNDDFQPQWLRKEQYPMTVVEAWERVSAAFPGVNREYVELLIVARAYAESAAGPVPMILVSGPSGSGKSHTVSLAAMIVGDHVRYVREHDPARFAEAIGIHTSSAGYLLLDEFGKKLSAQHTRRVYDLLLDVDRRHECRLNYRGPVSMELNSVVVATNNFFPDEVIQNKQIGRRVVYVALESRTPYPWEETCGTGDLRTWRSVKENAEVCDVILSNVIDTYLVPGAFRSFSDSAAQIGFRKLERERDGLLSGGATVEEAVRELFRMLASPNAPVAPDRWRGPGWKVIHAHDDTALANLWRTLCDDAATSDGLASSMRIAELELRETLSAAWGPVRLQVSRHGQQIAMRFVQGSPDSRGRLLPSHCKFGVEIELEPGAELGAQPEIVDLGRLDELGATLARLTAPTPTLGLTSTPVELPERPPRPSQEAPPPTDDALQRLKSALEGIGAG